MISSLPLLPARYILLLSLLVYCVIKGPIYCIVSLPWHICFSLPCAAARLPFDFLTPWIVWKYWWKPMLCDNEQISCQSALDLSTFVALYVTQDVLRHIQTRLFFLSDYCFFYTVSKPQILSSAPYPSACCLFIRQTICWSCVFFSACRPLGTELHVGVLYQLSDVRGAPSTSLSPLHGHEVCVLALGSLSARHQIMGRARGSPLLGSSHHSFGELINSSLWPAIIYSISWSISELGLLCMFKPIYACSRVFLFFPVQ